MREERLRDLGGLTLEMYKRDRFNAALVVERCAELVAVEVRIAEIDGLLGEGAAFLPTEPDLKLRRPYTHVLGPLGLKGTAR